jgi:hypothetical protein
MTRVIFSLRVLRNQIPHFGISGSIPPAQIPARAAPHHAWAGCPLHPRRNRKPEQAPETKGPSERDSRATPNCAKRQLSQPKTPKPRSKKTAPNTIQPRARLSARSSTNNGLRAVAKPPCRPALVPNRAINSGPGERALQGSLPPAHCHRTHQQPGRRTGHTCTCTALRRMCRC